MTASISHNMIKDGKGGALTRSGLEFETKTSLSEAFLKVKGITIKDDIVHAAAKPVARLLHKNKLYTQLLAPEGVNCKDVISKKLLPDEALYVMESDTLFIIEKKFQTVAGSVDEKLQTCDFKNQQYKKLVKPLGTKVKYVYVLSEWFKKKEYSDVLEYIEEKGCYYFFDEIPFEFIFDN